MMSDTEQVLERLRGAFRGREITIEQDDDGYGHLHIDGLRVSARWNEVPEAMDAEAMGGGTLFGIICDEIWAAIEERNKVAHLYELINISDCYTFRARPFIAASMALLVGKGTYMLRRCDDEGDDATKLPAFAFTNIDQDGIDLWFTDLFGESYDAAVEKYPEELADAMDSMLCCGSTERKAVEAMLEAIEDPDARQKAREVYHDKKRSSLNDIGGYCYKVAKRLRERGGEADDSLIEKWANLLGDVPEPERKATAILFENQARHLAGKKPLFYTEEGERLGKLLADGLGRMMERKMK